MKIRTGDKIFVEKVKECDYKVKGAVKLTNLRNNDSAVLSTESNNIFQYPHLVVEISKYNDKECYFFNVENSNTYFKLE